jgi:hypothetical protein
VSLWLDGDNQTEKRRNRESVPIRLLHPVFDIANGGSVTATVKSVDGDDVVSGETTHYTASTGISAAIVYSITLANNQAASRQASVHLIESGGSRTVANRIFSDSLAAGETVVLQGPWFLDPSDTIRSISSDAAANEVGLRAEVLELASAVSGVTFKVIDGVALTTSIASQYACPSSNVQHADVVAITLCNTDSSARTATVEIRPSGGSQTDRQNVMAQSLFAGESVIAFGVDQAIVLEPSDAVYAKASTGAVVSCRVTVVEYATS